MTSLTSRVYYYHDSIVAAGFWEFHNKIDADGVPALLWDCERLKLICWQTSLGLGTETHVTVRNILSYEP